MGKIELTYAWSHSRMGLYRECAWKYYLNYFEAWEGWLMSAPQEKRRAYMLKNMTNMPMFVGSIVHDVIENVITTGKSTGEWKTLEATQKDVIQALRKGWKQSIEKRWQGSPKKNVNLAEHFYQEEIDPNRLQGFKHKAISSIKAFYTMPLFQVMKELPRDDWLTIEDFQKFQLSTEEQIAVKIDCGFRYKGKVYLLDWKTGQVSDSVIDQLCIYSMYALKQGWAEKPEDIVIIPVYLAAYASEGDRATPHLNVTMQHIKRQAGIVRNEYPILTKAFDNKNNPSYFNKTDNERACKRCHFRDMCPGANTEISDTETPF